MSSPIKSESGAIIIQVAAGLLSLTMISALVVDYGMILVSRNEIQTAADAAALAGATALAFDNYTNHAPDGPAATAAHAVAAANSVWQEAPGIAAADVTFPFCSVPPTPTGDPVQACVQVDLYRDVAHGNPLPSYFGQLMGVTASDVSARAIAIAMPGNATDCVKPLAIPDRWAEHAPVDGTWEPASTFARWDPANPNVLLDPRDTYDAPSWSFVGTGLNIVEHLGVQATLRPGTTAIPVSPISPWKYLPVQIPGSLHGNDLRANINQCAAARVGIGDQLDLAVGATPAMATAGLQDLIARDPTAHWDAAAGRIVGSCADARPRCASISPRLIALPVYDVNDLANHSRTGATDILVRNIVGFFIESIAGNEATGYIAQHPGLIQGTASTVIDNSTFLRVSLLVK